MTENKEMTIEDALVIALTALRDIGELAVEQQWSYKTIIEYKQAAAVLRQNGEPVERSEAVNCDVCRVCGHIYKDEKQKGYCDQCDGDGKTKYTCDFKQVIKRWTETPVLKIVIEKSAPVYEPVENEE